MAELYIDPRFPDIEFLRSKARRRMPGFAFDYLEGGCNSEVNLKRNTEEIREIRLKPYYLNRIGEVSMATELFGKTYSAPFGIAPIGLQGMMWPRASEILAKAAYEHNIPYILSTVGTASIETIAEITHGNAWFQLYHPVENSLRDDLLDRCEAAGYEVLVLLADVPGFGYRPKEIKNGLAIPPRMTLRNVLQMAGKPRWSFETLHAGKPEFKTLKPYIPKGMDLKHLGLFMNRTFDGRLNEDKIRAIRDKWKGKIVLKGVASEEDTANAVNWGLDGIIVSNHGGRQLDAGESTIQSLLPIVQSYKGKIKIMMDSGIRTGPDIANTLAGGAEFTFLGRSFMYGVGALGAKGGDHTISVLKRQFQQVLQQLRCEQGTDLPGHLITPYPRQL